MYLFIYMYATRTKQYNHQTVELILPVDRIWQSEAFTLDNIPMISTNPDVCQLGNVSACSSHDRTSVFQFLLQVGWKCLGSHLKVHPWKLACWTQSHEGLVQMIVLFSNRWFSGSMLIFQGVPNPTESPGSISSTSHFRSKMNKLLPHEHPFDHGGFLSEAASLLLT